MAADSRRLMRELRASRRDADLGGEGRRVERLLGALANGVIFAYLVRAYVRSTSIEGNVAATSLGSIDKSI